jgi:hypothetical protein
MSNAPGFDLSAVRALVVNAGAEVTTSQYDMNDLQYTEFVKVWSPDQLSTPQYGHKANAVEVGADPLLRRDGEQFRPSKLGEGWPWQMACHEFARSFSIPKRQMEAMLANPANQGFRGLQDWQAKFTRLCVDHKNRTVAEVLAKGAYTAGVAGTQDKPGIYDGSFQGEADPYPAYIYDGGAWFRDSHTLKNSSTTVDNFQASLALDSAANLDTAYSHIRVTMAYDEQGRKIPMRGTRLIVPATLEGIAERILATQGGVFGSANADHNRLTGRLQLTPFDYLDEFTTTGWFVQSNINDGFHVIDSGAPEFNVYDDPGTDSVIVWGRIRFGTGISDFRWGLGCNLATS